MSQQIYLHCKISIFTERCDDFPFTATSGFIFKLKMTRRIRKSLWCWGCWIQTRMIASIPQSPSRCLGGWAVLFCRWLSELRLVPLLHPVWLCQQHNRECSWARCSLAVSHQFWVQSTKVFEYCFERQGPPDLHIRPFHLAALWLWSRPKESKNN